jgi:hypoxanthine phosphoribosyltransferase
LSTQRSAKKVGNYWECGIGHVHATHSEAQVCINEWYKMQEEKLSDLTELPLRVESPSSFPDGQRLLLVVDVQDSGASWKLIESLVGSGKLVAGCKVRVIQLVDKSQLSPGIIRTY